MDEQTTPTHTKKKKEGKKECKLTPHVLGSRVRSKVREVVFQLLAFLHLLLELVLLVEEENDGNTAKPAVVPYALKQIQRLTKTVLGANRTRTKVRVMRTHSNPLPTTPASAQKYQS